MSKKIMGKLITVFRIGVMSFAFAAGVSAAPLSGVYRGTIQTNCLESVDGFSPAPDLRFIVNPGSFAGRYSDVFMSTAVFPGDGTMTESVRGSTFFEGDVFDGALGAGTFITTCSYTLTAISAKSYSMKGSCTGTIPAGPAAGLGITVSDIDAELQVSEDNRVIIIGASEPDSNTLTLSSGYVAQRLCAGSATYVRARP